MKKPEYIFRIIECSNQWYWQCFSVKGDFRAQSRNYKTKGGCHNAAKGWVRHMKEGCAVIDDSWKESRGPKRKTI